MIFKLALAALCPKLQLLRLVSVFQFQYWSGGASRIPILCHPSLPCLVSDQVAT